MNTSVRAAAVSALLIGALIAPLTAYGHAHYNYEIGGKSYEVVIGSLNEPIAVDDKTGVDLRVNEVRPGATLPVEGLDQTLEVELRAGGKSKTPGFSPQFGNPGAYRAVYYPTVATTLEYRVFGTINGIPFDQTYACNPAGHPRADEDNSRVQISDGVVRTHMSGVFGCPVAKADLGFPEASLASADADRRIAALETGIAEKAGGGTATAALAVGFAGMILAFLALRRRARN